VCLGGRGPRRECDAVGRRAGLWGETVHRTCGRAGYYEEGTFARKFGDKECLVEIGCWGPVVNCNITSRGAINHMGGCMNTGGVCIGCTMPGFPDRFAPFYTKPPGSTLSTTASRLLGTFIRPLRRFTQSFQNREPRWDEQNTFRAAGVTCGKPVPSNGSFIPSTRSTNISVAAILLSELLQLMPRKSRVGAKKRNEEGSNMWLLGYIAGGVI